MAKGKTSTAKECKRYFDLRRRIKNKTRKLEKRIVKLPLETQEKILKANPIGRKKEKAGRWA